MLDVLQFVFQDFWHFLGTVLLIMVISQSIIYVVNATRSK